MIEKGISISVAIAFIFSSFPFVFNAGFEIILLNGVWLTTSAIVAALLYYVLAVLSLYYSLNAKTLNYKFFNFHLVNNKYFVHLPIILCTIFQYAFWFALTET
ncbi:hypothetical protein Q4575_19740 [Psychrosphaera sp. 1_MG-2023]|uniref:hypothetical protein n=1 Tax=Psychrosphaera sp. 1_MG-2023 TaxID=3062643 RepID=UPI0026E40528|nr:hypothetical protein [Psychrosphaera sp. 1_MG-2023]MDO6721633.1 hypothetical protein [Psychrosphaera sp. 1_MG-2023]